MNNKRDKIKDADLYNHYYFTIAPCTIAIISGSLSIIIVAIIKKKGSINLSESDIEIKILYISYKDNRMPTTTKETKKISSMYIKDVKIDIITPS
ncbi:hypothetical protein [uncultured Lactobacillus sp.]|uniref:hypothetical protein n=1 Tax=uncultured Lactobacillus sp. TaxID=153152 RepID=UPI0023CD48CF|nr:hypothetical protein [uncultured Lactobacillus sp.]MDE7056121.1 hypothetical protein [Lactobacillus sp.]